MGQDEKCVFCNATLNVKQTNYSDTPSDLMINPRDRINFISKTHVFESRKIIDHNNQIYFTKKTPLEMLIHPFEKY